MVFFVYSLYVFSKNTHDPEKKSFSQAQAGAEIATDSKSSKGYSINREMRLTSKNQRISWHSVHWSGSPSLDPMLWWGAAVPVG